MRQTSIITSYVVVLSTLLIVSGCVSAVTKHENNKQKSTTRTIRYYNRPSSTWHTTSPRNHMEFNDSMSITTRTITDSTNEISGISTNK